MKQKELSRWLKTLTVILAAGCALMCALIVPELGDDLARAYPEYAYMFLPCLIFAELTAVPVFLALYFAWRIFDDIGRGNSFTAENALRLRSISRLALADTAAYICGAAALLALDLLQPGILAVVICIVVMGACFTVASAALSHLTLKAAALKDDSDLTI